MSIHIWIAERCRSPLFTEFLMTQLRWHDFVNCCACVVFRIWRYVNLNGATPFIEGRWLKVAAYQTTLTPTPEVDQLTSLQQQVRQLTTVISRTQAIAAYQPTPRENLNNHGWKKVKSCPGKFEFPNWTKSRSFRRKQDIARQHYKIVSRIRRDSTNAFSKPAWRDLCVPMPLEVIVKTKHESEHAMEDLLWYLWENWPRETKMFS